MTAAATTTTHEYGTRTVGLQMHQVLTHKLAYGPEKNRYLS